MGLYIWYSAATDVTGKKIQEALKAKGGTGTPPPDAEVLCWGTKIADKQLFPNKVMFNNPNNILANRNKFNALKTFKDAGVPVADFSNNFAEAGKGAFNFPLVMRTTFHQGGAGFWLCLNTDMVKQAAAEGANYMQSYIHIKHEYRLHVVKDKVIYAVEKVKRENHQEAFKEHYKDYVNNAAAKKNTLLDGDTTDFILTKLAKKFATGADMIIRSNTRGWKFSKLNLNNLDKGLQDAAINALKALGLDYGAVDCCLTTDGKVVIIECNTGPGLEGTSFEAWTEALQKLVAKPAPVEKVKEAKVAEQLAPNGNAAKTKKEQLKQKMRMLDDMIDAAETDKEIELIEKLWKKAANK